MKKYGSIIIAIATLAGLFFLWRSSSEPRQNGPDNTESSPSKHPPNVGTSDRMDRMRDLVRMGNVDIKFRGRVVDQDGAPLEGAEIKYRVEVVTVKDVLNWTSTYDRGSATSGADGIFEIKEKKGSMLLVGPFSKTGYRNGQKDERAFSYIGSPELHDVSKTVDFLMVREDIPRTKEIFYTRLAFAWNKGEFRIPLGSKLGDFILIPTRDMRNMEKLSLSERKNFDWNVKVLMDHAELANLPDDQSGLAPDSGYQSIYEYEYLKTDKKWSRAVQARYAFRTEDKRYGFIYLNIKANGDDFSMSGDLSVLLNESGARNLD